MHRTTVIAIVAGTLLLGACSSSGDDAARSTTQATTTTRATTTTGAADPSATSGLPSCPDLQQEYFEVFTPDDLQPVIARFRAWAPEMPEDVGAAVTRLADAYEQAGTLATIDITDAGLMADGQTFTDWMDAGCPPA